METVSEGKISELHIGLKGTMNAMFLSDLSKKTREGLRGRALAGKSAGGQTYGYRAVRAFDETGERLRGDLEIHPEEAAVVRRIMADYASGLSPKKIAAALNLERIPGPRGGSWGASTIHGNRERGTGILNNDLYIGTYIWNRLTYDKDPLTGKRVSRLNPEQDWVIRDVPELRIIDDALWDAVRQRQGALVSKGTSVPVWDRRRPRFLFSGLMECGCCGGGFSKVNKDAFGCSRVRNKGRALCTNILLIKRLDLEGKVLHALEHHLMDPVLVEEFCKEYATERNRLQAESHAGRSTLEKELARVIADHGKLVDAIVAGVPAAQVKDRMNTLDARRTELEAQLSTASAPPPLRYHPGMARNYRDRVGALIRGLSDAGAMSETKEALRELVDRIVLTPDVSGTGLTIDLHGALGGLLRLATARERNAAMQASAQSGDARLEGSDIVEDLLLVAGACNRRNLPQLKTAV